MEHSYVDEHNIADCYVLGKLSAEERLRFEEHCENCMQCSDQLEAIDGLRTGLLILDWSRSRRNLAQITLSVAEWRRKYEEREQAARDLMKEAQARDQQL